MANPVVAEAVASAAADAAPTAAPTTTPEAAVPAATTDAPDDSPSGEMDRAIAAYRAAVKAPEQPAAPEAPAPAAEPTKPEPAAQPAPAAEAEDEKIARIWGRISGLEKANQAKDAELVELRAAAEEGKRLKAARDKHREDPEAYFREIGWDQKTIMDYLTNGPKAVSPELAGVSKETQSIKEELATLRKELAQREEQAQVAQAKARIPELFRPEADKFPLTSAYYDNPTELAETVWSIIHSTYQQQKTVLSVPEAATHIEKVLGEQAKRLSRARSKNPEPSTPAPAAKQPSPTLTNTPPGSSTSRKSPEEASDEENFETALAQLRGSRK